MVGDTRCDLRHYQCPCHMSITCYTDIYDVPVLSGMSLQEVRVINTDGVCMGGWQSVYGSNPYAADSNFGRAVVHYCGTTTGVHLAVEFLGSWPSFSDSFRNGVSTYSFGSPFTGYRFLSCVAPPPLHPPPHPAWPPSLPSSTPLLSSWIIPHPPPSLPPLLMQPSAPVPSLPPSPPVPSPPPPARYLVEQAGSLL